MTSFFLPLGVVMLCVMVGILLGSVYLWLLWMTIKNISKTKHKALLLLLSAIVRISLF